MFTAAPLILKFEEYHVDDTLYDCLEYEIIGDPEPDLSWQKDGIPLVLSSGNKELRALRGFFAPLRG